jgi:hypothetical protein
MPFQRGTTYVPSEYSLDDFDTEISYGTGWVSLNDLVNYRVSAEGFGSSTYQRKRVTADSPFYDGEFYLHSTIGNVTETIGVMVHGYSQSHVTENINALVAYFSQPSYRVRKRMDDHMETWSCQPADYSVDRSHVYMHNCMAVVKLDVQRHPKVTWEEVL